MRSVQQQKAMDLGFFTAGSVVVLLIHYYIVCHQMVPLGGLGPFERVIDSLREKFQQLPFTGDEVISKLFILVLMIFPSFFSGGPPSRKAEFRKPAIGLGVGLLLFFGTAALLPLSEDPGQAWTYIIITSLGYLLAIYGIGGLTAALRYRQYLGQFQRDTGFEQEEDCIQTDYSLNLPATYTLNGRKRGSWINIVNPRRGVLIMGSPGSGKSWFIIEPLIEQLIRQGRALFVYDFKFPTLSQLTYHDFCQHQDQYPAGARFYCINFTDLSRSHRCNIIDPATLENNSDALGISRTILLSMNRTWAVKQGDFFVESPIAYLAALIWYLRNYRGGVFCTLPHVIELSKAPYEAIFTLLNAEPETRGMIGPFKDSYVNKNMETLDGQIASARIPLTRLDSPDFYYVLSGNDLKMEINKRGAPIVLCLGGDPRRQEALAPVLSLYVDRLNVRINRPGCHPCALVIDEFATVRATSVLGTIATARSNDIITVLSIQDLTQLIQLYSRNEAEQVMNIAGNLISGQVSGETAKQVSQRFKDETYLKTTVSINSNDTSVSRTEHTEHAVTPATLAQLSSGEFIGVVADDPDVKLKLKGFHASLKRPPTKDGQEPLPTVSAVTQEMVKENYGRIRKDIEELIQLETKRVLNDPALNQYAVRR